MRYGRASWGAGACRTESFIHRATAMQPLPNPICPLCGGANQCAPARAGSLDVECWCTTDPVSQAALARVPTHLVNKACLCPRCAAGLPAPDITSEG